MYAPVNYVTHATYGYHMRSNAQAARNGPAMRQQRLCPQLRSQPRVLPPSSNLRALPPHCSKPPEAQKPLSAPAATAAAEPAACAAAGAAASAAAGGAVDGAVVDSAGSSGSTMTPRAILQLLFGQQALPLCSGLNLPPRRHEHVSLISVTPQMAPSVSPGPWHGPPRLTMLRSLRVGPFTARTGPLRAKRSYG